MGSNKMKKLTYKLFSKFSYVYLVKYYLHDFLSSKNYYPIYDKRRNPWHEIPSIAYTNNINVLIFYFDWKENYFGFFIYKVDDLNGDTKTVFEIEYMSEKDFYNKYNGIFSIEQLTNISKYRKEDVLKNQLLFLQKNL